MILRIEIISSVVVCVPCSLERREQLSQRRYAMPPCPFHPQLVVQFLGLYWVNKDCCYG